MRIFYFFSILVGTESKPSGGGASSSAASKGSGGLWGQDSGAGQPDRYAGDATSEFYAILSHINSIGNVNLMIILAIVLCKYFNYIILLY